MQAVVETCHRELIRECSNRFLSHKDFGVHEESFKLRYFDGSLEAGRSDGSCHCHRRQIVFVCMSAALTSIQLTKRGFL